MTAVKDVLALMNSWAPLETAMSWDNCGLLAGRMDAPVTSVLTALDITPQVIEEARLLGAELIVSHHPVIFEHREGRVTDMDTEGRRVIALLENKIAAICMHTNLDLADGGVDDTLAKTLGFPVVGRLADDCAGRVCRLAEPMALESLLALVKERLKANGLRYVNMNRPVSLLATGCGSCGDYLMDAYRAGCDTFITGDVKYSVFCDAKALGMNLIDAGHFPTENVIVPVMARRLREAFPLLEVRESITLCQPDLFC